jgi:hypothetical protein
MYKDALLGSKIYSKSRLLKIGCEKDVNIFRQFGIQLQA